MDFVRKIGDFEAALQETLKVGKRQEASRAKLSYLVTWLLVDLSIFWCRGYLARRFVRILERKWEILRRPCKRT